MAGEKLMHRRGKTSDGKHKASVKVKEYASGASGYKPHNTLLINPVDEPSPMWYDYGKNLAGRDGSIFDLETPLTNHQRSSLAKKYRSLADEIFRVELSLTHSNSSAGGRSGSDERWVENTMKKGTLKDRIAATSVLVSTDPIHKLSALDSLLNMAGCSDACQSNSRVAQMAAEALEDLFLNTLLPPGRKLLNLDQRPLDAYEMSSKKTLSPRVLLLWRFEEILKDKYQSFVDGYLVSTLRDGMDLNKTFAIRTAGSLLRSTPEGEAQLLVMMVNKLGDPGKKIAASAGHELRRVLEEHENMQGIAAREVQQLAHRPHLSSKALYNCIVFLNQLKLRNEVTDTGKGNNALPLAVSLVNTYFRMFDVAMKKQFDERVGMKSRLLSALLTGINRAHQFLPDKDQGLDEHMDSLYNISHTAAPSASTQALMLLYHVSAGPGVNRSSESKLTQQDRYYRAVYAKLSMPSFLRGGKHLTMFFNLLYKTMKYDTDARRVLAFTKRLLCTVAHSNASVTAASLFLLNELMKTHKQIAVCLSEIPVSDRAELSFDPSKREPRAAIVPRGSNQLDGTVVLPLWEICLTSKHFHPSVAKFATSLGVIEYSGDPLRDFTLAPFLDKFAYKNPKVHKKGKANFAQRRVETQTNEPLNDPSFLKKQNVDDADKFFHRFFTERARRDDIQDISPQTDDDDCPDEEVFEMLDEREIDQLFNDENYTDPEEEEFVEKLAINLMIESKNDSQADFDNEDPDMGGWDDLQDGDSLDSENTDPQEDAGGLAVDDDVDTDMDDSGDKLGHEDEDEDDFMDDSYSDDDVESDGFYVCDNSSDSAHKKSGQGKSPVESSVKAKRKMEAEVFVDADEYEKLIDRAYIKREKVSATHRSMKVRRTMFNT